MTTLWQSPPLLHSWTIWRGWGSDKVPQPFCSKTVYTNVRSHWLRGFADSWISSCLFSPRLGNFPGRVFQGIFPLSNCLCNNTQETLVTQINAPDLGFYTVSILNFIPPCIHFYRCGMNLNWMFFSYFIVCAGNVPIMNRDITRTGTVMLLLCGFNSLQLALNKEKFSAKATAYHQLLMIYKCQFGSTQCLFALFTVILFNVSNQEQKLPANPVWLTCKDGKDGKDRPRGRAPVITFIFTSSLLHLHM